MKDRKIGKLTFPKVIPSSICKHSNIFVPAIFRCLLSYHYMLSNKATKYVYELTHFIVKTNLEKKKHCAKR